MIDSATYVRICSRKECTLVKANALSQSNPVSLKGQASTMFVKEISFSFLPFLWKPTQTMTIYTLVFLPSDLQTFSCGHCWIPECWGDRNEAQEVGACPSGPPASESQRMECGPVMVRGGVSQVYSYMYVYCVSKCVYWDQCQEFLLSGCTANFVGCNTQWVELYEQRFRLTDVRWL